MTANEITGIIDTAFKMLQQSTDALMERDWGTFFNLHEQSEKALMFVQPHVPDAATRIRIQHLLDALGERREIALVILEGSAIGDA